LLALQTPGNLHGNARSLRGGTLTQLLKLTQDRRGYAGSGEPLHVSTNVYNLAYQYPLYNGRVSKNPAGSLVNHLYTCQSRTAASALLVQATPSGLEWPQVLDRLPNLGALLVS
jgi:hypothetical protein